MSSNISLKQKITSKIKFSKKYLAYFTVILGFALLASLNLAYAHNQVKESSNSSSQVAEVDSTKLNQQQSQSSNQAKQNSDQPNQAAGSSDRAKDESSESQSNAKLNPDSSGDSGSNHNASSQPQPSQGSAQPAASSTAVTVNLSVNGINRGLLSLSAGSNQCQVLNSALASGRISGLDMRYNSSLGSMGVYVIDGVGDSSSVWWTYTVNGKSPPLGCSGIKVNQGDQINWVYVKR